MTKNPGFTPAVRPADWPSFTSLSNANLIAIRVKKLAPDVALVLNPEYMEAGFQPPDVNPDQINSYLLVGTITAPNGNKYKVTEIAGQLWDRQFVPYASEDKSKDAHNPCGGPNLSWQIDSEADDQGIGQANLFWTVDPQNPTA